MIKLREAIKEKIKYWDERIAAVSNNKNLYLFRKRLKKRWLCRNDLYYLAEFTGHNKLIEEFHRPLCEHISLMNWKIVELGIMPKYPTMLKVKEVVDSPQELGRNQRLYLLFRSAFKTTLDITLHTIQLLLNFPEIHIALSHNTQVNASDILEGIKNLFLTSELARIFPEYIPDTKEWGNKTGFSVACRKDYIMKGDNVEAIGIGTEVTGRKYHIFKNDDIVTEKSVTNEEQLKQSRDYLELHKSLFVNPSIRVEDYCGTKYHFADAYAVLEENPDVEKTIIPLLKENDKGTILWNEENYKCIVPEMFSAKGIKGLMENSFIFSCQYMLKPQDPKKIKFTQEMLQYFTAIPQGLNYYLVVDPADSEEKRACYTAMKVIGVDYDDNWFWVDGLFDKIDDRERIDEALRLTLKWNVFEVLWESLSFGRTDARNFERRRRELQKLKHCQVREIKASRTSKDDRILGLNDRYSRHKIFWPPKMLYYSRYEGKVIDIVKAQEYEFLGFPLVSHKDLLDAESFLLQIDLIKGDRIETPKVSKFAYIKDPVQRGTTEVFWRDWEKWKERGFATPEEILIKDNL